MKKKTKKNMLLMILLCLALSTALVIAGCGNSGTEGEEGDAAPTYDLRCSVMHGVDHIDTIQAQKAADLIKERTEGAINITVYPSNQLGDYTAVFSEVMMGTIDMAVMCVTGEMDPRLEIYSIPYLFSSWEECREKGAYGTDFFNLFDSYMQELGCTTLGFFNDAFAGLAWAGDGLTDLPQTLDYNVDKQDMMMRVPPYQTYNLVMQAMGFSTTSIAYAELYPALQTGVADGWIGGGPYLNYMEFLDVIDYYVDALTIQDFIIAYINKDLFDSMPEDYQQIIIDVFTEVCYEQSVQMEEYNNSYIAELEANGVECYVPTEEEVATFAAYVRETVWPQLDETFGEGVMEDVSQSLGL